MKLQVQLALEAWQATTAFWAALKPATHSGYRAAITYSSGGAPGRGVNSHATSFWEVSEADVKREIEEAAALGVGTIRVPVEWRSIEEAGKGERGGTALERLDLIVEEAIAHGIMISGTIATTPPWASPGGAWNDAPLEPEESLRDFAKWLTERYPSRLTALSVWNEPTKAENLRSPTGETLNRETEEGRRRRAYYYVQMVKAVFNGTREGAAVKVLVHEDGAEEAGGVKPLLFLKACYEGGLPHGEEPEQEGFASFYDGIGIHAYSEGAAPEAEFPESTKSKIERLRAFQEEHEESPVPMWVNEWGYSLENSEETNAEYVGKGVALLDSISYVEGWAYFQLRDTVEAPEETEDNFGLLKFDFTQRPSFAAFKGEAGPAGFRFSLERWSAGVPTTLASEAVPLVEQEAGYQVVLSVEGGVVKAEILDGETLVATLEHAATYTQGAVGIEGTREFGNALTNFELNGVIVDNFKREEAPLGASWTVLPWALDTGRCLAAQGWVPTNEPSGAYFPSGEEAEEEEEEKEEEKEEGEVVTVVGAVRGGRAPSRHVIGVRGLAASARCGESRRRSSRASPLLRPSRGRRRFCDRGPVPRRGRARSTPS